MGWRRALFGGAGAIASLTSMLAIGCGSTSSEPPSASGGMAAVGGAAAGANASGDGGGGLSGSGGASTFGGSAAGGSANGGSASGGSANAAGATGTVQIGALLGPSTPRYEASARFAARDAVATSDCTHEAFGDCRVSTCTPNGVTAPPPPTAGTITISDGSAINLTLVATNGAYLASSATGWSLSGGEQLTITAEGGDVPAFAAQVAVPKVITVSAPAPAEDGSVALPASGDVELTFDNRAADGETGTQLIALGQGAATTLYCALPTTTGQATIPGAALDRVRGTGGQLLLLTARTVSVQAGAFNVGVIAYLSAMNPAKSKAVTFKL